MKDLTALPICKGCTNFLYAQMPNDYLDDDCEPLLSKYESFWTQLDQNNQEDTV